MDSEIICGHCTARGTTWTSVTDRSEEILEVLGRRKVDICCVQETRWKGKGVRMLGGTETRYKFFWQGHRDGNDGVGLLVTEKWVDKVVEVNRVNERIMCVKIIIGCRLFNIVSA